MSRVGYFEIFVDDLERAQRFYAAAFGWTFRDVPFPYPYVMIDLPPDTLPGLPLGGMTPRQKHIGTGHKSSTVIHIMVDDLTAACDRIRTAGGSINSEVMSIPAGPFVYANDTENNTIGIWQPTTPDIEPK